MRKSQQIYASSQRRVYSDFIADGLSEVNTEN